MNAHRLAWESRHDYTQLPVRAGQVLLITKSPARPWGGFKPFRPISLPGSSKMRRCAWAVWLWTSSSRLPMRRSSLKVSKLHRGTLDQHSLSSVRYIPHNAQYSRDAQWCNCDCPRDLMPNVPAAMPRWAPLFPRSAEAKKLRTLEVGRGGRARPQGSLPPEIEIVAGLCRQPIRESTSEFPQAQHGRM